MGVIIVNWINIGDIHGGETVLPLSGKLETRVALGMLGRVASVFGENKNTWGDSALKA